MKLLKYLTIAAALLGASCTESAIDDLTGIYKAPTPCSFNSATDLGGEKLQGKRTFNVAFSNSNGDQLNVTFVGDKYFLHSAAFTPTTADNLKNGTYIAGAGGATFAAAGTTPKSITKGQIILTKDNDNYDLSGNVWLEDNSVISLDGKVVLHYEPDPEPVALTKVLSATNNVPNGTNSVTLQLATSDITSEFDMATWSTTYHGTGNYLAVDFFSVDGSLQPGTYSPASSDAMTEFTYAKGWDPGDLWGIGMVFSNWGTCWWTVDNGATSAVHIEEGNIEVAKSGSSYTISYNHNGIFFEFKGAIEGLGDADEPQAPIEYIELTNVITAAANGNTVTLKITDSNLSATDNGWGGFIFSGSGNYLSMDLITEDGSLAPGTYTAADQAEAGPGNFVIGYDPGDLWGIGIDFTNWGTCWWTVTDGVEAGVHIEEGTITVESDGEGTYTITAECGDVNARYIGTINI